MRRNFINEQDYINTVEQDKFSPPCCPKKLPSHPPQKADIGLECCCKTEKCKVVFNTNPFSDSIEIKCKKHTPAHCHCENKHTTCHCEREHIFPICDKFFF